MQEYSKTTMQDFLNLHFRSESIRDHVKDLLRVAVDLEDQLADTAGTDFIECTETELVDILAAADMLDKAAFNLVRRCRKLVNDRVVAIAAPDFA